MTPGWPQLTPAWPLTQQCITLWSGVLPTKFGSHRAFVRHLDLWMTFVGVTVKLCSYDSGHTPYPMPSFSSVPQCMTKYLARYIPIQTPYISNFNILTYLNVSTSRTPLMTFDPNIPTHITFPLLQGISTPHMNLIRLCVKKIWTSQKACTKSLTHWHTKHAAIRSFLTDNLKISIFGKIDIKNGFSDLFPFQKCILLYTSQL